jgi:hypothetical protein
VGRILDFYFIIEDGDVDGRLRLPHYNDTVVPCELQFSGPFSTKTRIGKELFRISLR